MSKIYLQRGKLTVENRKSREKKRICSEVSVNSPQTRFHLTKVLCREIKAENWKPMQKLIPNLLDKTNYVCHYRNLQFYIKHGLVLTKIHRVISFDRLLYGAQKNSPR